MPKHRDSYVGYGISEPETITRKAYRYRANGLNIFHGPQTPAHYSDSPRVALRQNETHRASQHRRFNKELDSAWQQIEESTSE